MNSNSIIEIEKSKKFLKSLWKLTSKEKESFFYNEFKKEFKNLYCTVLFYYPKKKYKENGEERNNLDEIRAEEYDLEVRKIKDKNYNFFPPTEEIIYFIENYFKEEKVINFFSPYVEEESQKIPTKIYFELHFSNTEEKIDEDPLKFLMNINLVLNTQQKKEFFIVLKKYCERFYLKNDINVYKNYYFSLEDDISFEYKNQTRTMIIDISNTNEENKKKIKQFLSSKKGQVLMDKIINLKTPDKMLKENFYFLYLTTEEGKLTFKVCCSPNTKTEFSKKQINFEIIG